MVGDPLLWLAVGLAIAGVFILGHDASHGALFDSKRMNRFVARSCLAPSAHVEAAWNLGHNRIHHGFTTREGFDFRVAPPLPSISSHRWARSGGFATDSNDHSSAQARTTSVWWEQMWRFAAAGKNRSAIRRDKFVLELALALVLTVPVLFGATQGGLLGATWLPIKLVVVPFLIFVHIIGWTVYVHHVSPDIRWWSRRKRVAVRRTNGVDDHLEDAAPDQPTVVPQHFHSYPASP